MITGGQYFQRARRFVGVWLCCVSAIWAVSAQDCDLQLRGVVIDEHDGEALALATIFVEETQRGVLADEAGNFVLDTLCSGAYHLRITHVGCAPERIFIDLREDMSLQIRLEHHAEFLQAVVVEGQREPATAEARTTLSDAELQRAAGRSLAEITDAVAGVRTLRTGVGIAKPITSAPSTSSRRPRALPSTRSPPAARSCPRSFKAAR